ncbi:MAG TPA: hypothetical protein VG602_06230 [Actinomycetota bacterium]|nr:hypothetical protein [Actinomycetota bacterium]
MGTWGRAAAVGLPADDAIWTMEVAPDDPKLIVASTFRGGVWRSVDGGASFQRTNNTWALDLQILPGGTVYVGGRGVFVSHDRGATFTGYQHSLGYFPTSDVYGLAADPRDPRHVAIGLFSFGFQAAQLGTLFHDPPV